MKKRIAFISEHASPLAALGGVDSGGQNVYVGELAKHLVEKGYQVDIFTRWESPNLPHIVSWIPDIRVIHVQAGPVEVIEKEKIFPFMEEFTSNMLQFIHSESIHYELIHANFWMSALAAMEIKKQLQTPFVVTFHALGYVRKIHQGDSDKFPPERIEIEKQVVQSADHIIAECPQEKEDLKRYYGASEDKITIIPCGFSPHEFYPLDRLLARMVLNIEHHDPIILQLGRMVPRKGVDTVIKALAKVRRTVPMKLMIVGGETEDLQSMVSPEIERLQKIAQEEGVLDSVVFAGRKNREQLKYYYAAADVFVTTPWYEPFGITPLEAMACGTPVIGSAVGGIKYSVDDGVTGFLIPPNDPDALADKLSILINDPALLTRMQENAIKRVNTLFTWSNVAQKVSALYERILRRYAGEVNTESEALSFIRDSFDHACDTFCRSKELLQGPVFEAGQLLIKCFQQQRKVLVCGNGGSAAESQHLVSELVGRFEISKRRGLPALSLTDATILTAWANDMQYDDVFARQVEAYGQSGDVLFCFSTSGQSPNVVNAMKMALEKKMLCIALTGKGGGAMVSYAHVSIIVPSDNTQRVQEMHLHLLHTLCSLVEQHMFARKNETLPEAAKASLYRSVMKPNNDFTWNRVA
jgi:D-inositol-3-phosphate glycosyltransferase